jgi:hypothetical protein
MIEPRTFVEVASLKIDDYEYPLCIPCWTEEEVIRAEKAAEKFKLLFQGVDTEEHEFEDPDTYPDPAS